MKHVAVLMGGWSAEREVSLRSGKACADALQRIGYRVSLVDVDREIATTLRAIKPDVALNVLHGRPGEDGTLQGMLEILGIAYTHSGVLASAAAMQKDIAKTILKAANVPVRAVILTQYTDRDAGIAEATNFDALVSLLPRNTILRFPWDDRTDDMSALAAAAEGSGLDALLTNDLFTTASHAAAPNS